MVHLVVVVVEVDVVVLLVDWNAQREGHHMLHGILHACGAIVGVVLHLILHACGAIVGVVLHLILHACVVVVVVAHRVLLILISVVRRHVAHKAKIYICGSVCGWVRVLHLVSP